MERYCREVTNDESERKSKEERERLQRLLIELEAQRIRIMIKLASLPPEPPQRKDSGVAWIRWMAFLMGL